MKSILLLFSILLIQASLGLGQVPAIKAGYQLPKGITSADYQAGKVILKLNESLRPYAEDESIRWSPLNSTLSYLGEYSIHRLFPHSPRPTIDRDKQGRKLVDISLIYELKFATTIPVAEVINRLQTLGIFEYVEPKLLDHLAFIPNDPEVNDQWHLILVKAFQAWDITKGDTNVKVGVIDTGIDLDHIDLRNNLAYNHQDPINGFDDDADGYIDNYHGWNLAANTNDPSITENDHGVHVSGCVATTTNNGVGGAGVGWNTRILPIKGGAGNSISRGYEGIVYAADQGCDFINCSWGSYFSSEFNQEIINYATVNKGALIFGGAGNRGTEDIFYPAAYQYVMSVGATTISDARAGFSNYGHTIDVLAPGNDIWSTIDSSKYGLNQGTSMSSPVAAGCAALVKAHFPWMTAEQCGEQIRVTADNVDNVPPNPSFAGKLGRGRVNLVSALAGMNTPSVVLLDPIITDDQDGIFGIGETVYLSANYLNYLAPTGNLSALLTTSSSNVTIVNGSVNLGVLNTLENKDNYSNRFAISIQSGVGPNEVLSFRIRLTDGTYMEDYFLEVLVNKDYLDITENRISTSMMSNGRVGYKDLTGNLGLGLSYDNSVSLIYEAGLMVGQNNGTVKVVDALSALPNQIDDDFRPLATPTALTASLVSDFDGYGRFDDSIAGAQQIGLDITQRSFAWNGEGHRNYVIFEYTINNTSGADQTGLHAGMFVDWDLVISTRNKALYNPAKYLGYCQYENGNGGLYAGVQLLTPGPFYTYSIDFRNNGNGGVNITDVAGYSTDDKWTTLSSNRTSAGLSSPDGDDVGQVVSAGPFDLLSGDSTKVAFAFHVHDTKDSLFLSADSAYYNYNGNLPVSAPEHSSVFNDWKVFPNPSSGHVSFRATLEASENVQITVLSLDGRTVYQQQIQGSSNGVQQIDFDLQHLSAGTYLWQAVGNNARQTARLVFVR